MLAEFHEFLSSPRQNILDRSFSICPLKNCFVRSQNRLSFYFFWNKKFICRKKCCFRRISWVFIVPSNLFWVIYVPKKSAIFAENMKKVGVCRFKKVRFLQPFGVKLKIKNLSKKKKQYMVYIFLLRLKKCFQWVIRSVMFTQANI